MKIMNRRKGTGKRFVQTGAAALICTAVLMLMAAGSIEAQTKVRIQGRVIDRETAKPVAGALVVYQVLDSSTPGKMGASADSEGRFQTEPLLYMTTESLLIEFTVSADGYTPLRIMRAVNRDRPVVEDFQLQKDMRTEPYIRKVFRIKYRDPGEIYRLILPFFPEKSVSFSPELHTISVHGPESDVEEAGQMIERYDVPLKQIWLEVYLIKPMTDGEKEANPKEIAEIVKKLESLFKFDRYKLIGRASAVGLEGSVLSANSAPGSVSEPQFRLRTQIAYHEGFVQLKDLHVQILESAGGELVTSANIRDGETVILGASSRGTTGEALVMAVKVKIMD